MRSRTSFRRRLAWGFLVAVFALSLGLIFLRSGDEWRGNPPSKLEIDMHQVQTALHLYKLDCGQYPPEDEGLMILVDGRNDDCVDRQPDYLASLPLDPWGRQFIFRVLGRNEIEVVTLGADGKQGGIGNTKDLTLTEVIKLRLSQ